jgi:hypothetical protein
MKRREFLQATAASLLIPAQGGCAQAMSETIGDAALRLNPAIFPEERVEKREFDNSRSEEVRWETTVCKSAVVPKDRLFTLHDAFIEKLATQEYIPCMSAPLFRADIQTTPRTGFYAYFKTTVACLKLPNVRPPQLISTSGKYFHCGRGPELVPDFIFKRGWISIDYRKLKLIEGRNTYHPTHQQYRPVNPDTGAYLEVAPSLIPITEPDVGPKKEWKGSSLWVEKYLFFDIPHRPLRFKVELPPLIIQDVEVPLPTYYFEPYDVVNNTWM